MPELDPFRLASDYLRSVTEGNAFFDILTDHRGHDWVVLGVTIPHADGSRRDELLYAYLVPWIDFAVRLPLDWGRVFGRLERAVRQAKECRETKALAALGSNFLDAATLPETAAVPSSTRLLLDQLESAWALNYGWNDFRGSPGPESSLSSLLRSRAASRFSQPTAMLHRTRARLCLPWTEARSRRSATREGFPSRLPSNLLGSILSSNG